MKEVNPTSHMGPSAYQAAMEQKQQEKYIGILVSAELQLSKQCHIAVRKAWCA